MNAETTARPQIDVDTARRAQEVLQQKRMKSNTCYSAPPIDWITQQCKLYFQIKKQYAEKYNGKEAIARSDACVQRVFFEWKNADQNEKNDANSSDIAAVTNSADGKNSTKSHKHRQGSLRALLTFLRKNVSDIEIASHDADKLSTTYAAQAHAYFTNLLSTAMNTVYKDLSASTQKNEQKGDTKNDANKDEKNQVKPETSSQIDALFAAMQVGRQNWQRKRLLVRKALHAATKTHDYDAMQSARDQLDEAEQMCSYYAHATVRTAKDVEYRKQCENDLRDATTTFCAEKDVEKKEQEKQELKIVDEQTNQLEKNGDHTEQKDNNGNNREQKDSNQRAHPFIAFLRADETLIDAERHVVAALQQYVDPRNPALHRFAAGVERHAFIEASSFAPNSPILSTIAALSGGKSSKLFQEKTQIHNLVNHWTSRFKESPFVIVRGINDRRGHYVREQRIGNFTNVCRAAIDTMVLSGEGRTFTAAERQTPDNVYRLFCAEPGCFHIAFFDADPRFSDEKRARKSQDSIAIRLHKPHITLSHTVLAPGYYVVDATIYMPGIDRGRAVAVCSHVLSSVAGATSDGSWRIAGDSSFGGGSAGSYGGGGRGSSAKQPLYATAHYDATIVESLVKSGRWQDAHDLTPTRILYAGNATLFLAASANNLEMLGFIVVGTSGRCMLCAPCVECTEEANTSAYRFFEADNYTQTRYVAAQDGHDDALYIDALCGIASSAKTKIPRGVGFCLMAHALAYHARAHPSGVLMRVRSGAPPLRSAIDASVAFYYYSHFGMQCVSSDVARDTGLDALAAHYDGRKTVSKQCLKDDGMYAHVRNILGAMRDDDACEQHGKDGQNARKDTGEQKPRGEKSYGEKLDSENVHSTKPYGEKPYGDDQQQLVDLEFVCGKKPETIPAQFIQTLFPHDNAAMSNILYRRYPHVSELYDRITLHLSEFCCSKQGAVSSSASPFASASASSFPSSFAASAIDKASQETTQTAHQATTTSSWNFFDECQFVPEHNNGDGTQRGEDGGGNAQNIDVSESFGGFA